jgi:hypothetical protein
MIAGSRNMLRAGGPEHRALLSDPPADVTDASTSQPEVATDAVLVLPGGQGNDDSRAHGIPEPDNSIRHFGRARWRRSVVRIRPT